MSSHGAYHHSSCTAGAKWTNQCCWQSFYKPGISTEPCKEIFHCINNNVKNSACSKHTDSYQHSYEIRNDFHSRVKSSFCTGYKGIEQIHLFIQGANNN